MTRPKWLPRKRPKPGFIDQIEQITPVGQTMVFMNPGDRTMPIARIGIGHLMEALALGPDWRWPAKQPSFGEGRYVWRDEDWVRP